MNLALLIVAAILFLLAAVNVPVPRVSLLALGMFFGVLSLLWGKF
jgi:hypothetical protein